MLCTASELPGFLAPQPSAVVIEEVLLMRSELRRSPRSCCHSSTRSLWPSYAFIARPGGRHEQTARHSNTDGLLCADSDRRLLGGPLWLLSSLRYVVTGHGVEKVLRVVCDPYGSMRFAGGSEECPASVGNKIQRVHAWDCS